MGKDTDDGRCKRVFRDIGENVIVDGRRIRGRKHIGGEEDR